MNQHALRKNIWFQSGENITKLREALLLPQMQTALNLSMEENLQRFSLAPKNTNDKIVGQSSLFDQMKGWNDCLNFLNSLAQPPTPDKTPSVDDQYPDEYVKETFEKNYQGK